MGWISSVFYRLCWLLGRAVFFCTMNLHVIRRRVPNRAGPYVLAVTHLSHLEPFIVGLTLRRTVNWIARLEFYRSRFLRFMLHALGAFKVNRQGVPVSTIRTALDRLRRGNVVGIFPEGGVSRGRASVVNGGPIKNGACLLACRAGVPIVPVVVVGAHELLRLGPWMPARRAHAWIAFGEPIDPLPPGQTIADRRVACRDMGERLKAAFQQLHEELCETYQLGDRTGATYAEPLTASSPANDVEDVRPAGRDRENVDYPVPGSRQVSAS